MTDPNVLRPAWDAEMADPPFKVRALTAGRTAGATELGATLYEIDPGSTVSERSGSRRCGTPSAAALGSEHGVDELCARHPGGAPLGA